MTTRAAWELMQIVRVAVLICFLPVLLYRIRRIVRDPTSVPAVAVTAFGVSVWIWFVVYTDWVWAALPPGVRAVSVVGWPAITIAACLQVFVIGIRGDASQERIRRGLWVTVAGAVIALTIVVVAVRHSELIGMAGDALTIANIVYSGADSGAAIAVAVSSAYMMLVVLQLAWVGSRNADRTPVGVGLGLLAAASMFQVVASFCGGIWRPLSHGEGFISGAVGVWLQTWPGCIAAVLIVAGFLWPPVMLRVQAQRELRRLRPLRDALGGMFPGLFPPVETRIRLSDLVFEWVTHIQDGLTLLAQRRRVPLVTNSLVPKGGSERTLGVANWLVDEAVPGFSCEWLRPPEGVSDGPWVLAIADAYRERQERLEAPASLSGMPSTLRK
ncbi:MULTISPECIES: hypothetical protein [unclassified Mycobacterium]|uniref:hypothetical protein n=1 Tax=unclassified Mycobacterium TaxID=2642494 RepID=UPI002570FE4C|nr:MULTISPECIES: hypothetical protein [unclassified Mycobacterium]